MSLKFTCIAPAFLNKGVPCTFKPLNAFIAEIIIHVFHQHVYAFFIIHFPMPKLSAYIMISWFPHYTFIHTKLASVYHEFPSIIWNVIWLFSSFEWEQNQSCLGFGTTYNIFSEANSATNYYLKFVCPTDKNCVQSIIYALSGATVGLFPHTIYLAFFLFYCLQLCGFWPLVFHT